jgi:hypothetical protein
LLHWSLPLSPEGVAALYGPKTRLCGPMTKPMKGSQQVKLKWIALTAMLSVCAGCVSTQTNTAFERIKPKAAKHAEALADDDIAAARETGLDLLSALAAYGDW